MSRWVSVFIIFVAIFAQATNDYRSIMAAETLCSDSWYRSIEETVPTSDNQGHGPDVGSGEWTKGGTFVQKVLYKSTHLRDFIPMPRLARLDAPGILHHVMGRGIERKKIFINDTDRNDFIDALAQQVCKKYSISLSELRSGSRRRNAAKARGSISWIAVRELGYSGADVARYLGVSNSCVTRFVASGQKPDVDDLIKML
jgi:hypothetical protein